MATSERALMAGCGCEVAALNSAGTLAMHTEDGARHAKFGDDTESGSLLEEVEIPQGKKGTEEPMPSETAETCCDLAVTSADSGKDGKPILLKHGASLRIDARVPTPQRADSPRTPTKDVKWKLEAAARPPVSVHWRRRKAVLCFGASLTEGLVSFNSKLSPYSDRLQWRLHEDFGASGVPPKIINAGISGESARDMGPRMQRLLNSSSLGKAEDDARLLDEVPDVVLILGGTNDLSHMHPKDITELLVSLHRIAHSAGAITGVLTIPESLNSFSKRETFKDVREEVNRALREFAREHADKTTLVDVAATFPQDEQHADLWSKDGTHFSAKGYKALGDLLAETDFS